MNVRHLLTGAVVFPLVWLAIALLLVAEALGRLARRLGGGR